MQNLRWNLSAVACVIVVFGQLALAMPNRVKRQDPVPAADVTLEASQPSGLNPLENEELSRTGLEREKRKLPEATFGAKNAVLGFVFGDYGPDAARTRRAGATVNISKGDAAELDRGMVMLDLPPQLFSQSFTTVTNLSKIAGSFISNTARRYAKVVYFFKPLFGNTLEVQGHDYIPTTTTKKPSV